MSKRTRRDSSSRHCRPVLGQAPRERIRGHHARAWNDYWLWKHVESKRQYAELQRLKRVHWEKGTFASEEHLAQAERILDDHQAEGRKQLRQMSRDIDDARRRLRRVDHVFLILTHPGASFGERMRGLWRSFTTKPFSL
jgi:hypothetical protein